MDVTSANITAPISGVVRVTAAAQDPPFTTDYKAKLLGT